MSAATQAPDTPRRHLLTLARRQLSFPNMSVVDEVAAVSAVADPVRRDEVFTALCEAVRDGDARGQADALNVLAGGLR